MDFARDEVRRQLRESQRDHEAAQPLFDEALKVAFDPDSGTGAHEKARLLGLPDRRGFLKLGGLSVAMSAVAVACVNDKKESVQLAQTGTLPATTSTVVAPDPGSPQTDATLVLTAISIERLAIDVYQAALDAGWLTVPLLQDAAKYFQGQHKEHAASLSATATQMGQKPADVKANEYIKTNVVDPQVKIITTAGAPTATQNETLKLALELEDAAAQTYTMAGGVLTKPALRQAIMSIGAIEAKHYSVLAGALQLQQVPFAFGHTNLAAPPESYIQPNGPVAASSGGTSTGGGVSVGSTPRGTARPGTTVK
jgi:hypothetical protein